MKKINLLFVTFIVTMLVTVVAFAQQDPTAPVSNDQLFAGLSQFLSSVGGLKGLGLVSAIVQLLLLVAKSSFDPLAGTTKIYVVLGLNLLGVFVANLVSSMVSGQPLALSAVIAALVNGATIAAAQVLINQIIQQKQKA